MPPFIPSSFRHPQLRQVGVARCSAHQPRPEVRVVLCALLPGKAAEVGGRGGVGDPIFLFPEAFVRGRGSICCVLGVTPTPLTSLTPLRDHAKQLLEKYIGKPFFNYVADGRVRMTEEELTRGLR